MRPATPEKLAPPHRAAPGRAVSSSPATSGGFKPQLASAGDPILMASEGTAGAAHATLAPLASLLSREHLQNGETVLLVLRPSLWFIVFNSALFIAAVAFCLAAAIVFNGLEGRLRERYLEIGIFLSAGWITWSVLLWLGRLYILTDLRILRLTGVFSRETFDCPLRRVAETRMLQSARDRLLRVGSIEITPSDSSMGHASWQTVARPAEVIQVIQAAITRARQSGAGGD
jgi:hypothetical protein